MKVLLSLCFVRSIVVERRGPRLVARGGFKSDCEKFQAGLHNRPLWYKGSSFLRFLLNGPIVCILFDYDFYENILFSILKKIFKLSKGRTDTHYKRVNLNRINFHFLNDIRIIIIKIMAPDKNVNFRLGSKKSVWLF